MEPKTSVTYVNMLNGEYVPSLSQWVDGNLSYMIWNNWKTVHDIPYPLFERELVVHEIEELEKGILMNWQFNILVYKNNISIG